MFESAYKAVKTPNYTGTKSKAEVVALCLSPTHSFGKPTCDSIRLIAGLGVEDHALLGTTATISAPSIRTSLSRLTMLEIGRMQTLGLADCNLTETQ